VLCSEHNRPEQARDSMYIIRCSPAEGSRDCISNTVTAETVAEPCAAGTGVQVVRIVFQQN